MIVVPSADAHSFLWKILGVAVYRGMLLLTGHDSTSSTRPRWGTIRRLSIHSGLSLPVPGGDDQVIVGTSPPVPLAGPSISRLHAAGGRNGARNASPFCMRNQRAKPMPRSSGPDEVASLSRLRHVRDDAEAGGAGRRPHHGDLRLDATGRSRRRPGSPDQARLRTISRPGKVP